MSNEKKVKLKSLFFKLENKDVCDPFKHFKSHDLYLLSFTMCQVLC